MPRFTVGSRVRVRWNDHWFPATVTKYNARRVYPYTVELDAGKLPLEAPESCLEALDRE